MGARGISGVNRRTWEAVMGLPGLIGQGLEGLLRWDDALLRASSEPTLSYLVQYETWWPSWEEVTASRFQ